LNLNRSFPVRQKKTNHTESILRNFAERTAEDKKKEKKPEFDEV
jgi:hypothetical protein